MAIEILSCSNCGEILEEDNYVDCGLYDCQQCNCLVDADYDDVGSWGVENDRQEKMMHGIV
jgi:hypothetical protein